MKNVILTTWLLILSPFVLNAQGRKQCIDNDWRFHYGQCAESSTSNFDDSGWRKLNLPHDWSVETDAAKELGDNVGPFSHHSIGGSATGFTVGGEGWYRKHFTLQEDEKDKLITLYFEGVYNQTEVWVNGRKAGENHYGYQSFRLDITNLCYKDGRDNVISVRVKNEGQNSRWYAGSGIFRHVWLLKTPRLHLQDWETFICCTDISEQSANIHVSTILKNESSQAKKADLIAEIYDKSNQCVATKRIKNVPLTSNCNNAIDIDFPISQPELWSPDSPTRYKLVLHLQDKKTKETDEVSIRFGIRDIKVNAEHGFLLNGEPMLLRGGCVHHDNGLLGAAAWDQAEDRKLTLLKEQGYNAVRCSHNLPSEHFLDACDSLGLMVIDECFDQWNEAKNKDDYHQYFPTEGVHDIQLMVRRDRNHPSIVFWSIGNEIPGRIEPEGVATAERLREAILQLDSTRPLTAAICDWDNHHHSWQDNTSLAFKCLDVGGYNYLYNKYENDHEAYPQRVMMGTESYPKRVSENWTMVEQYPYIIGDFVWTAMDYLGEAGIGSAGIHTIGQQTFFQDWPWYNGWCGDIDLIGEKKPQSYYRDVVWRRSPITMGVQQYISHGSYQSISAWGWQLEHQAWDYKGNVGDTLEVNVYSRASRVRLYLNDSLIAEKPTNNTFWAGFSVGYRPGTLRAVAINGDTEGESFALQTPGEACSLRLRCDRKILHEGDLAYVTIELEDANGHLVADSEKKVSIIVEGGTVLAAGNASPTDMESFRSTTPRLYEGRAQVIIQAKDKPFTVKVNVVGSNDSDKRFCVNQTYEVVK